MSGEVLSTGEPPYWHVVRMLAESIDLCGWLSPEQHDWLWDVFIPIDGRKEPKLLSKPKDPLGYTPAGKWSIWPPGLVLFGECRDDPRREKWCAVSRRWGFGTMKSLEDKAGISRDHRQHPGRMRGEEIRRVLAAICYGADQAGDLDGFDRWLEGRIRRPDDLFIDPSEVAEYQALIEQAEWCLGTEGLRRLAEYARLLTLDPECVEERVDPEQLEAVRERVLTDRYRAMSPSVR